MLWLNTALSFLLALPLGMGVGGGGLFLLFLSDGLGLARESAVFLNLVFFLSALLSSAVMHLRKGRLSLPFLGVILLLGVPSALLGRWLATLASPRLLRVLLALLLVGTGLFTLLSSKKRKDARSALDKSEKKGYNKS